jgi:hypothetical protein
MDDPQAVLGFLVRPGVSNTERRLNAARGKMRCFDKEEILYLLRAAMTNFEFDTYQL